MFPLISVGSNSTNKSKRQDRKFDLTMVLVFLWSFSLMGILSCATPSRFPEVRTQRFPKTEGLAVKEPGVFLVETYFFRGKDVDFGTILVPENRNKPESRLLPLPFLRYRSKAQNPLEPVFYLTGGPGMANAGGNPGVAEMFLDAHDVVFVGYRGMDGKTYLPTLALFDRLSELDRKLEPVTQELITDLVQAFQKDRKSWQDQGIDLEGYTALEVVDDMESIRSALGYEKINLFGQSYGTRLAYYYSLRYPQQVNRAVQLAVNPPGGFYWKKDHLERVFGLYNQLWKKDPEALKQSPDLYETWKNVLNRLPVTLDGIVLTRDILSSVVFGALYSTENLPLLFKLLISAEKGDFAPLAALKNQIPKLKGAINGDSLLKGATSDYLPLLDYRMDWMENHPGNMPYASLMWLTTQEDAGYIKLIPQEYRIWRDTEVETLLINGSLDPSTPPWDLEEYASYYKKGRLIIVPERSHVDVFTPAPGVWRELLQTYFRSGNFDDSRIPYLKARLY